MRFFYQKVYTMKRVLQFLSYVMVATLASVITLALCVPPYMEPSIVPEAPLPTESKLDQLSALIQEQFIGDVDVTAMEDAAAAAMVEALGDRWSHYISAEDYSSYVSQMANSYVGIGITITVREDGTGYNITQVAQGGPAEQAGILAGDILIGAAGQRFANVVDTSQSNVIRGDAGTFVDITVLRNGEEKTFNVERRLIKTVAAKGQMISDRVGLVTIYNFHSGAADEAIKAVEELRKQGAKALLFDLRNNPGGYKSELVKILDHLLPEGPLFRSLDYLGNESVDQSGASFVNLPMAVLVNGESYSAAEFFAAAIKEYDAGFIAGTQTCGKGYFQITITLKDGSAVGLSVGKYFTPNGVSLAEVGGLTPDLVVEVDEAVFNAIYARTLLPEEDPQIQAALARLLEK